MCAFEGLMTAQARKMDPAAAAKTLRFTVETESKVILRRARTVLGWCPFCRAEVDVIALHDDNGLQQITAAQLQECLRTGSLHSWKNDHGLAEICLPSLFLCLELDELQRICRIQANPMRPSRRK